MLKLIFIMHVPFLKIIIFDGLILFMPRLAHPSSYRPFLHST